MRHPYARARRLARQVVLAQAIVALAGALAALPLGLPAALGAGWGAAIAALGSSVLAWRQFGGELAGAQRLVRQFYAAAALKWLVLVSGWLVAIAVWRLPFLPLLAGFVAAQLAMVWATLRSARTSSGDQNSYDNLG